MLEKDWNISPLGGRILVFCYVVECGMLTNTL